MESICMMHIRTGELPENCPCVSALSKLVATAEYITVRRLDFRGGRFTHSGSRLLINLIGRVDAHLPPWPRTSSNLIAWTRLRRCGFADQTLRSAKRMQIVHATINCAAGSLSALVRFSRAQNKLCDSSACDYRTLRNQPFPKRWASGYGEVHEVPWAACGYAERGGPRKHPSSHLRPASSWISPWPRLSQQPARAVCRPVKQSCRCSYVVEHWIVFIGRLTITLSQSCSICQNVINVDMLHCRLVDRAYTNPTTRTLKRPESNALTK